MDPGVCRTTTHPNGHGSHLVDRNNPACESGFACYSLVPKAEIPPKVIEIDYRSGVAVGGSGAKPTRPIRIRRENSGLLPAALAAGLMCACSFNAGSESPPVNKA